MIVIVTNKAEYESLMPDVKYQLIRDVLFPTEVRRLFVEKETLSQLDTIGHDDTVLVETKSGRIIEEIRKRNLKHTGECDKAILYDSNKVLLREAIAGTNVKMPRLYASIDEVGEDDVCFVKPLILEDSIGVDENSLCLGREEVRQKAEQIMQKYNKPSIIEEYVDGYEVTCGIVKREDGYFIKAARITSTLDGVPFMTEKVKTQDLRKFDDLESVSSNMNTKVAETALSVMQSIGARKYARMDFRVRGNVPYLIEVNLYPGLKNTGAMYRCFRNEIGYLDFLKMIFNVAIRD